MGAAVFVCGIQSAICTVVLDSSRCLFTPDRTGALLAEGQGECQRDSRCVPLNSGLGIIVISPDFILSEEIVLLWFEISYHQHFLSLPSVCSVLITRDLSSHLSPTQSIEHSGNTLGWHWKRKSCTTCYARNVYQNWILSISTGAEFLSSAISSIVFLFQRMLAPCRGKNIDDLLKTFPVDVQESFNTMTDFITQRASDWKGLSWKWNGLGLVGVSKIPSKGRSYFGGSWGGCPCPQGLCRWPQSWHWWFRMGIEIVSFVHWPKNLHQKHATSTRSWGTPQAKNEKNSPVFKMFIIFPTCPFWGRSSHWFLLVLV